MLLKVLFLAGASFTKASYDIIGGYMPMSKVTDHNAIDLDQLAIEELVGAEKWADAKSIYENGGNSRSQVVFTIPSQSVDIPSGLTITGTDNDGNTAEGKTRFLAQGGTSLTVRYTIYDSQSAYVKCRSGAMSSVTFAVADRSTSNILTGGCFIIDNIMIANMPAPTISPLTILPTALTHTAGRTIQGFNLRSGDENGAFSYTKFADCPNCPYKDFMMFYNYYQDINYADNFVKAALDGTSFTTTSGNFDCDFNVGTNPSTGTAKARIQGVKKGTDFLNVWMYVIREYEDAIADCKDGNLGLNEGGAHAWDEGVAFYTGSLEGEAGTRGNGAAAKGVMLYDLADYRCQNFKTCGPTFDATSGTSQVNYKIFESAALGQHYLLMGECDKVRVPLDRIVDQMRVPMIQGAMRYAYRIAGQQAHDSSITYKSCGDLDKCQAEAAVFAAAVLPALHLCSPADATTVATNLKLQHPMPNVDFAPVKKAFEDNYACLNVTCADIGGLWAIYDYYPGFAPCVDPATASPSSDSDDLPSWALAVIVAVSVLFCVVLSLLCCIYRAEKATGEPVFNRLGSPRPGNKAGSAGSV